MFSQIDCNDSKTLSVAFMTNLWCPVYLYLALQTARTTVFCGYTNTTTEIPLKTPCFVEQLLIKEFLLGSAERNSTLSHKNGTYTYQYYGACVHK